MAALQTEPGLRDALRAAMVTPLIEENARLRAALTNIASQDLDENGEPGSAEHWVNYSDAGSLASALVHCAATARDALKGGE